MAMHISLSVWVFLTASLGSIGCGSASFDGGSKQVAEPKASSETGTDVDAADYQADADVTANTATPDGKTTTPDGKTSPPDDKTPNDDSAAQIKTTTDEGLTGLPAFTTPCPSEKQDILIIDLNSGWWEGDAEGFTEKILGAVSAACPLLLALEYHHFTSQPFLGLSDERRTFPNKSGASDLIGVDIDNAFLLGSMSEYQQIWVLSGARIDPVDLSTTGGPFKAIEQGLRASAANVFLAGTSEYTVHANALAKALELGIEILDDPDGEGLNGQGDLGAEPASYLDIPQASAGHALLSRDVKKVASAVRLSGAKQISTSGSLKLSSNAQVVAGRGADAIEIATTSFGDRRVVVDAGVQRYYAITSDAGEDTLKLLQNVAVYLAK